MIIVVRKNNIALIALIFMLSVLLYGINAGMTERASPASGQTQQWVVMLDPGHGGEDPGAVSDYSGIKESVINLYIAMRVKELLEKQNFKVLMTRTEDRLEYDHGTQRIEQKRKQDLLRRKELMDNSGADLVVSIHLNKFQQPQYFGAQTFYPPDCEEGRKAAEHIQKVLREKVDPNNTRQALAKKEQIIILKNWKTPTTIVECGFLSNPGEEQKLRQKEYQDLLAEAIAEGIVNYFRSK